MSQNIISNQIRDIDSLKNTNHFKFKFRIKIEFLGYCFVRNGIIQILTKRESLISIAKIKKKSQN